MTKTEFGEFAIEAWKAKSKNLRHVINQWHLYIEHTLEDTADITEDPASVLVVALLACSMDTHSVRGYVEAIRNARQ